MMIILAQNVRETEEKDCNRHCRLTPSTEKRITSVLKALRPMSLRATRDGRKLQITLRVFLLTAYMTD